MARVTRTVPPLRRAEDRAISRGEIPLSLRRWEYIDWDRTLAYSQGLFGNVYINLRGREPEGCVAPEDYDRVREDVARQLLTLTDPEDGDRIVNQVYRREELYSGPYLEEAPDLVVTMRDYAYMTRGGNELSATDVISEPTVNHSGNHRLNGMLIMQGPGIRPDYRVKGAHIMDVMPTVLHILGVPVPADVDGRVLSEAMERPEFLADLAQKLTRETTGSKHLSRDEEQLIRDRLKNLGYMD